MCFTPAWDLSKPVYDKRGPRFAAGRPYLLCLTGYGAMEDIDIVFHLSQKPVALAAPELVEHALIKAGAHSDNVTLVAMEWETPDAFATTRGNISTDDIEDGVFASTVQAGGIDGAEDDLDDAAIERSIAKSTRLSVGRRTGPENHE